MKVIMDGQFVINCIKKNIDFISQLRNLGLKLSIPRESLQEMKGLKYEFSSARRWEKLVGKAINQIENSSIEIKTTGRQRIEDWLLQKGNEGFYIATCNSSIKGRLPAIIEIDGSTNSLKIRFNRLS